MSLASTKLRTALTDAAAGSQAALRHAYVAGVALLQSFLRDNWAGPSRAPSPPASSPDARRSATAGFFLIRDGEDVAAPAQNLHYLRAALYILVDHIGEYVRGGAHLASWWACRALLAHNAVLTHPSPSLQYDLFTMFARFMGPDVRHTRDLFGAKPPADRGHAGDDDDDDELFPTLDAEIVDEDDMFRCVFNPDNAHERQLMLLAYLELCVAQRLFYDSDAAARSLRRADELANVAFRAKGEMGVRTKFQTKPTAQLVARAFERASGTAESVNGGTLHFVMPLKKGEENGEGKGSDCGREDGPLPPLPRDVPLNDTDLLGYIKLTEANDVVQVNNAEGEESSKLCLGAEKVHLTPLEQSLAICHASVVRARNASHLLTKAEMAPFINLVLRNATSPHGTSSVVQLRALMMRVSFERERGRFLERSMAQMEEVSRFVDDEVASEDRRLAFRAAAERALFAFAASLPPRWELKKELAISFGKIGLVKSAMKIFEELEFWDELVDCHRLIGNLGAAESMVRKELEKLDLAMLEDDTISAEPDESRKLLHLGASRAVQARAARRPRLLCVLGDVTRDRTHFETAWAESGGRYARAKRALARLCVEKGEWEQAVVHFRDALQVNALFPDAWFTYGCAALQINDLPTSANAFTRVVQQTPQNGEAWNNLGRVLHEMGKKKEALAAMVQAGRYKRKSWRIWNNVLTLAMEIRNSLDLVRAMEMLLELRGKDGVVAEAIGIAVEEVIRMSTSERDEDVAIVGDVTRRLLRILARCTVLVSTNAAVWAAHAQMYELLCGEEGVQKAFDSRLKQVRSLIAHGDWKRDEREFRRMVVAVQAMATDAVNSQNEANVRAALLQATSISEQSSLDFGDDDGWKRIERYVNMLRAKSDEFNGK